MISQAAGAAESGASVSAVTEVTGVTDNADQLTKNKPPSQLPELIIASTPVSLIYIIVEIRVKLLNILPSSNFIDIPLKIPTAECCCKPWH